MRGHAADCEIAFSQCSCGLGDKDEEQDEQSAKPFEIVEDLFGGWSERRELAPPAKPARLWSHETLWHGIPIEFEGAVITDALKEMLNKKPSPASFAIVGPPGTGKTRSLWGMLHSMRKARLTDLIGEPIGEITVADGSYVRRSGTETEAIKRELGKRDRMRIESEVGFIRAKRYDREALQELIDYPYWLAVDDIGAATPNDWVSEAIYHLANERRANGLTTVWTSNLSPQKIRDTFGAAIASRILGGVVIETSGKDRRIP
jgi:hypothetical protein